jgi:hypothetical protein
LDRGKSDKGGAKRRRGKVVYKEEIQRKRERISEEPKHTQEQVTAVRTIAYNASIYTPRSQVLTEELTKIQVF